MSNRDCSKYPHCKSEGNCCVPGIDNLPVQCVGEWVKDKYYFLERYIEATREARRMFADKQNAVFIDLFAGPGKCVIRDQNEEILSGGLRVLHTEKVPFNEAYFLDMSKNNINALEKRSEEIKVPFNSQVLCGDSNILVEDLVRDLCKKPYRYHFAYIDPFGPDNLKFNTLKELAKLERMDMLIHFPIGAIKRNLKKWTSKTETILDNYLGTPQWRTKIRDILPAEVSSYLIDIYKEQFKTIGYPEEGLKTYEPKDDTYTSLPGVSVKNTKEVDLYILILASKHPLGQKIWNNIIKTAPSGQREFNF